MLKKKIQPVFLYLIQSPTIAQHKPVKCFDVKYKIFFFNVINR